MAPAPRRRPTPSAGGVRVTAFVLVALMVGSALGACSDDSPASSGGGTPSSAGSSGTTPPGAAPGGFDTVVVRIGRAGQPAVTTPTVTAPTEQCAYLADTAAQRAQGLMRVTSLAGRVGMVFRFPADVTGGFYMRNTPMPLSIAWFDAEGHFVSSADMAPCGDRADCPTSSAAGAYRYALEVPRGDLASLGVGPGATLELGAPCRF